MGGVSPASIRATLAECQPCVYGSLMDDTPKVKRIESLRVGESATSQLVLRLLKAIEPADASIGIQSLANSCLVSGWTVYRWLRGTHSPRSRQLVVLETQAKKLNVEEAPPASAEEAPSEAAVAG